MTDEELRKQFEKTWRHFDVVAEGLRKDIRLVAEGIGNLDEKFTRESVSIREEMKESFAETHALIRFGYRDLDRRKR